MREKKFTAGPWKIDKEGWGQVWIDGSGIEIVCMLHGDSGFSELDERERADATLIISAPDMVEALEDIQKQIQQVNDGDKSYTGFNTELIDAALAKAYGETE